MYEFTIVNNKTNEERIIFGYGYNEAMERANYNRSEWTYVCRDYID